MEDMQISIGAEYTSVLAELSKMLHTSPSDVIKRAVGEGFRDLRMKVAMEKYIEEEFSLCRAAEFAGVSIQQMARYLTERGIPFFRQTVEESIRDANVAEGWLRDAGIN